MDQWMFWVATTIIGLAISSLRFYLKKHTMDIDSAILRLEKLHKESYEKLNERVAKLETRFQSTIEEMPLRYTLRDDFLRAVNALEGKLDKILDKIGGTR